VMIFRDVLRVINLIKRRGRVVTKVTIFYEQ